MTMATLKNTPLSTVHSEAGAKMVDFSGWNMPLQFSKVLEEHHQVRNSVGLFDISHMGLVSVTSTQGHPQHVLDFLNTLVPQDLSTLYPGKAVYTQFLNEQGGIIDDIIVYMLPEGVCLPGFSDFLVICNAGNTDIDLQWMKQHQPDTIQIKLQADYSLLALQGPAFAAVLNRLGIAPETLPKRFHLAQQCLSLLSPGPIDVITCRTGYTGEDGVELIVPNRSVEDVWQELLKAGQPEHICPVGLAARDTLRIEAAYPLHGHDISVDYTPFEAGLGWSVKKLDKPGDFIGKAALRQQKAQGLNRKFYCFKLDKRTIARQNDLILNDAGQEIGIVTSGSISPTLGEPIAMGYLKINTSNSPSNNYQPGDKIQIQIRGKAVDAHIVSRPFLKN